MSIITELMQLDNEVTVKLPIGISLIEQILELFDVGGTIEDLLIAFGEDDIIHPAKIINLLTENGVNFELTVGKDIDDKSLNFPMLCLIQTPFDSAGDFGSYVMVTKVENGSVYFDTDDSLNNEPISIDEFNLAWFDAGTLDKAFWDKFGIQLILSDK